MSFNRNIEPAPFNIALRPEHISEFERRLYLQPRYDTKAIDEYAVKFDSDDTTLLTASGPSYHRKGVRDIRDSSGLPLFECEKIWTPAWRKRGPWLVRLPGSSGSSKAANKDSEIASTHRTSAYWVNRFDMTFRNAAAQDVKGDADRMVTLHIRSTNALYCNWIVSLGDRTLVHIRESVDRVEHQPPVGKYTTSVPDRELSKRLTLDVIVAENFDLSLVSSFATGMPLLCFLQTS